MKLKQQPVDFIVEELPSQTWSEEKQAHAVYRLEKEDVDTFAAIRAIARKLRLPQAEIGYAGLKDKHAHSTQYITLPAHCNIGTMKLPGITIQRVGYLPQKIQIGDLQANKFTITIRDLQAADLRPLPCIIDDIRKSGVPNYYDSQRFGSVIDGVFIAKLLIQGHDEGAVKQVLTSYQKSEPKTVKDEKRRIAAHWNDLEHIQVTDRVLSYVISEYTTTHDWQKAYLRIPAHLREIHANAYQSYLWNETFKELLQATVDKKRLIPVQYAAGILLFPTNLTSAETEKLPKTLYTASETAVYSGLELAAFKKILTRENITQTDLANLAAVNQYLKARPRDTFITPTNLTATEPQPDELNTKPHEERWKLTLSFSLTKGSYATIITKRLFGH
jgi:tRNA pseudouridine13 synthase